VAAIRAAMRAATYAAARTMTTVCLKFAVCIWQRLVAATAAVRSGVLWHGAGGGAPARAKRALPPSGASYCGTPRRAQSAPKKK